MGEKRKVGRPTKYKPEMCEAVYLMMRDGMSIAEVCRELEIKYDTYKSYEAKYPEFLEAIKNGEFSSRGWWEKKGRENLGNREFNHGLWYMNMKNRFGWTDRPEPQNNEEPFEATEYVDE